MASLTEGTPTPPPQAGTGLPTPGARLPAADRLAMLPAAVLFAALMAVSTRYGWHRDELYFLDCARHLSASYVDQPVLTPLLARVSLTLFGVWLPGLRVWAALAGAATVIRPFVMTAGQHAWDRRQRRGWTRRGPRRPGGSVRGMPRQPGRTPPAGAGVARAWLLPGSARTRLP